MLSNALKRSLIDNEVSAVIGTVISHEITILRNIPHLIPLIPYLAKPTPRTAETAACVVDIGMPHPHIIDGIVVNNHTIEALARPAADPVI